MSKVMTSKEFIKKLEWFTTLPNVYYSGKYWSQLNDKGQWRNDCVLSVKSILWGFSADKNKYRGGTVYKSNGVADFTCNGGVEKYSTNVSTDFSHLIPGEYLCMKGTSYNHTGIYLGNGKVFEMTSSSAWGVSKAIISEINSKGERFYKGKRNLKWTYHGQLIYIDYSDEPKPINQVMIWQEAMNKQWNCGLAVDGSYGPLCKAQAHKHYLHYLINAPIMVKWLQTRLNELGYNLVVDGSFGPKTLQAVKNFQKKMHIAVDGYVGSATVKALTE